MGAYWYQYDIKVVTQIGPLLVIIATWIWTTVDSIILTLKCAGGNSRFQNSYFHMFRSECSSLGGSLASIHSKEEDDFIFNMVQPHGSNYGPTFLGATRVSPGIFEWDDNTPWDYENWNQGNLSYSCPFVRSFVHSSVRPPKCTTSIAPYISATKRATEYRLVSKRPNFQGLFGFFKKN